MIIAQVAERVINDTIARLLGRAEGNMADPVIAQKGPYVIDEKPGKKVWCACGQSAKQPYCDGSHAGTDHLPEFVHVDTPQKVAWCGCKHSGNKPYCDGSHSKLK